MVKLKPYMFYLSRYYKNYVFSVCRCFVENEVHKNIIITVVTILIITSSGYTIFICSRCKKYRKESNIIFPLLMSVFAAGLLRGISCIIVCVLCWIELHHFTVLLQIQFVLVWFSVFAKNFSLAILSAIKSLSVLKPFFYIQRVTRNKILMITLLIWFLSLVSAVPMILPIAIGFRFMLYKCLFQGLMGTNYIICLPCLCTDTFYMLFQDV